VNYSQLPFLYRALCHHALALLSAFVASGVLLAAPVPDPQQSAEPKHSKTSLPTYTVGIVPQFAQRQLFATWQPILKELTVRTGFQFKLVGTAKIPEFEQQFNRGKFDIAYMNPYHVLKAYSSQKYQPIVRDGKRMLRGILVVHKNSGITNPAQLAGKTLAMPSPNSLGASLLIRADLKQKFGVTMQAQYVKTHSSVYLHVAKQLVAAGGGVLRTLRAQRTDIQNELSILYQTRAIVPHPITIHPRVPEAHRQKIKQAILTMAQTDIGKQLLAKIPLHDAVVTSIKDYKILNEWGLDEFYE